MKLEAKQVFFLPVLPWFGRRRVRFVGKSNTIQLADTALVIEGQRKMLGLWVVDLFFQQALSEWTTITIPYSRIVGCRYSGRWIARGFVLVALVLPVVIGLIFSILSGLQAQAIDPNSVMIAVTTPIYLFVLLLLLIYVEVFVLPSQYALRFRSADGRVALTHFRIKRRAHRQAFEQRLAANRKAAAAAGVRNSIGPDTAVDFATRGP